MNPKTPVFLLASCLILSGCNTGKAESLTLKRGLDFAERQFRSVRTNALARLSFQSTLEQGGSLTTFLAASSPPEEQGEERLPKYCEDQPCGPYSIALSYDLESGEVVMAAYAEDLSDPIEDRRVKIELNSLSLAQ